LLFLSNAKESRKVFAEIFCRVRVAVSAIGASVSLHTDTLHTTDADQMCTAVDER
jgi:hypothetical protein